MKDCMKKLLICISAVLFLSFVASCATAPAPGIYLSRKGDVDAGVFSVRVESFGPGDVPTVIVTGCGERNATIEIMDTATGKVVETRKEYVPRDWIRWWAFPDLPAGSYQAVLLIAGDRKGTASFTVKK